MYKQGNALLLWYFITMIAIPLHLIETFLFLQF